MFRSLNCHSWEGLENTSVLVTCLSVAGDTRGSMSTGQMSLTGGVGTFLSAGEF